MNYKRIFLIVLDSVGAGEAPDAKEYGDEGSNTLRAISKSPKFKANTMKKLGLLNIEGIDIEGKPEDFTNTKNYISKLPPEKRDQIRELIKEELMKRYKTVIGLSDEFTFGFELEATGISDKTLKEVVSKTRVKNGVAEDPVLGHVAHRILHLYRVWNIIIHHHQAETAHQGKTL